jgi:hypothetical protein
LESPSLARQLCAMIAQAELKRADLPACNFACFQKSFWIFWRILLSISIFRHPWSVTLTDANLQLLLSLEHNMEVFEMTAQNESMPRP